MEAACVFRDAPLAVKIMHSWGWVHGGLKPPNIGMFGMPLRSVLLEIGKSAQLTTGAWGYAGVSRHGA